MTKLKTLPARLTASSPSRLSQSKTGDEGRVARRGTAAERGYDHWWRRQSEAFRAVNPYCDYCWLEGRRCRAEMVDHLYPPGIRHGQASDAQKALFRRREYWVGCCHLTHKSFKAAIEREGIEAIDALATRLGRQPLETGPQRSEVILALAR